jgi:hypothetical protein
MQFYKNCMTSNPDLSISTASAKRGRSRRNYKAVIRALRIPYPIAAQKAGLAGK